MTDEKEIMLICNYFSQGCTGNLLIKALTRLGYALILVDPRVQALPKSYSGTIIVWANKITGDMLPKESHKIIIYLDDPDFWINTPYMKIENLTKGYDEVYTLQKVKGYKHLPFGTDLDIYTKRELEKPYYDKFGACVAFVGTLRYKQRFYLLNDFINILPDDISFKIWGNGMHHLPNKKHWQEMPVYFYDFSVVCNTTKIIFNEHFKNSPNTKDFEVTSCGSALYIVDDKAEGTKEMFPMVPTFKDAKELLEKIKYYLSHEKERMKLVKEMQEIASKYTYKDQILKVLK